MNTLTAIEAILQVAKPGDMIEFKRDYYSHWGIYIGDSCVIHRWGENDGIGHSIGLRGNVTTIFGVQFNKAKIMKTNLATVLRYGGKIQVNNYLDSKYQPLPIEMILEKANNALGREGYNVIYDNCEHFATDCRYGQSTSRQVQKAVVGSLLTGLFITALAAGTAYIVHRSDKKDDDEEMESKITMSK